MRPRDFLVVGVCDNIFNFHHETTRPRDGGWVTIFLILTTRPQDFLVVVVCDNIFNFHHETTRPRDGGWGWVGC